MSARRVQAEDDREYTSSDLYALLAALNRCLSTAELDLGTWPVPHLTWANEAAMPPRVFDDLREMAWERNFIAKHGWGDSPAEMHEGYGLTEDGWAWVYRYEHPGSRLLSLGGRRKAVISLDLRWAVWERDNFTCQHCGVRRFLSIDHITPESKGGTLDLDNLQTLCRSCNSAKGAR